MRGLDGLRMPFPYDFRHGSQVDWTFLPTSEISWLNTIPRDRFHRFCRLREIFVDGHRVEPPCHPLNLMKVSWLRG